MTCAQRPAIVRVAFLDESQKRAGAFECLRQSIEQKRGLWARIRRTSWRSFHTLRLSSPCDIAFCLIFREMLRAAADKRPHHGNPASTRQRPAISGQHAGPGESYSDVILRLAADAA